SRAIAVGLTSIATIGAVLLGAPGTAQAQTLVGDASYRASALPRSDPAAAVANPLLFYRASDGVAVTGLVDSAGGFTSLRNVGPFGQNWTHITSTGGGRLLFYRASDGVGVTGLVDSAGGFTSLRKVGGFLQGWTHITSTGG